MLYDSQEKYGAVSRFFHWVMTVLIFWQMLKLFDRTNEGEHWVGQVLVPWHISIGVLLLVLIIGRLGWFISQRANRPPADEQLAVFVKVGHGLLYLGMLLMPVTGLAYMVGKGYGLTVFGVQLVAKSDGIAWLASIGGLHPYIAWTLLVLIAGHIVMAFVHQFIKKDGLLQRMLG